VFDSSDEDYRWAVLRTKVPPWLFELINVIFIGTSLSTYYPASPNLIPSSAFIQNVLLLVIACPTVIAVTHPSPLTRTDGVLALTALALLAWEFTADNQQFAYHAWKHGKYDAREHWPGARLAWTKDDAARGFCTRGLWSWSRHPNFFAEQSFWVRLRSPPLHASSLLMAELKQGVLNLIPLLSLPDASPLIPADKTSFVDALRALVPLSPSIALCLLFLSSTRFTESISESKYPRGYAAYRARVSMFVPVLTPVWGALLSLTGQKGEVDDLVWGSGAREAENKGKAKAE